MTVSAQAMQYADAALVLVLVWAIIFCGLTAVKCCWRLPRIAAIAVETGTELGVYAVIASMAVALGGVVWFSIIRWS